MKFSSLGVVQSETSGDIRKRRDKKGRCKSVDSHSYKNCKIRIYVLAAIYEVLAPGVPGDLAFITPGVTIEMCSCFVTHGDELVVDLAGSLLVCTVVFFQGRNSLAGP